MLASPEQIEAARRGDIAALDRLLAICQPNLLRYARRTCATEDIEDAVQDALIIIYRRLGALRTVAAFSRWIFQIIKHECLRRLRRRGYPEEELGSAHGAGAPADAGLQLDLIRIIADLPPMYRDVLILRDVSELTAEETAERLDASVEAIKSRLHRARYLVRQQLG